MALGPWLSVLLCCWIDYGLETHSNFKGFHNFFKYHLSLRILLMMWGNSSQRICIFLSVATFVKEQLVFFLGTMCHQEAITSQITQKGDAPDNQWKYIHRLHREGAYITTNTCLHSYSMTACVDVNKKTQNLWLYCVVPFRALVANEYKYFMLMCTSDADVSHHVLHEECWLST